jgi:hypothetical protein
VEESTFSLSRTKKACKWLYFAFQALFYLCALLQIANLVFGLLGLQGIGGLSTAADTGWVGLVLVVVDAIPTLVVIKLVAWILRDVSKGRTPFSRRQVGRIRLVALFLAIGAVLDMVTSSVFISIATANGPLVLGGAVTADMPFDGVYINISSLFLALVVFCLSLVFEYGTLLQDEVEEIV